jgi:hypothetical protein
VAPDVSLPDVLAADADDETIRDLSEITSLLAELRDQGPRERALAISVLREVLTYARGRERRRR